MIRRFDKNQQGRDFAVGDIHGCFSALQAELDSIGFNEHTDRLFSVGDLVDRGPESDQVLAWLSKPWFHPVRGNHDDYVVRYQTCDIENWTRNGGSWFQSIPESEKQQYADALSQLPHAIDVQTDHGLIGIVHADPIVHDWTDIESRCSTRRGSNSVMWCRNRLKNNDCSIVSGVRAVIVGHTLLSEPTTLGNVIHIDTGGWHKDGRFTLLTLTGLVAAYCSAE